MYVDSLPVPLIRENVTLILDITVAASQADIFCVYAQLMEHIKSLPLEITISVIFFATSVHFFTYNNARLELQTISEDMIDMIEQFPYNLEIPYTQRTNVASFVSCLYNFQCQLDPFETDNSVMNSALYLATSYIQKSQLRSKVLLLSASSASTGHFLIDNDDQCHTAFNLSSYICTRQVVEKVQISAVFVGEQQDTVPYAQICLETGGRLVQVPVFESEHVNIILNQLEDYFSYKSITDVKIELLTNSQLHYEYLLGKSYSQNNYIQAIAEITEIPIALEASDALTAIQIIFTYTKTNTRFTKTISFSLPISHELNNLRINSGLTCTLTAKLVSLQQNTQDYKTYINSSTGIFMHFIKNHQIGLDIQPMINILYQLQKSPLFSASETTRTIMQAYIIKADTEKIIQSFERRSYLCTPSQTQYIQEPKAQMLDKKDTSIIIKNITGTRIFVCTNDKEDEENTLNINNDEISQTSTGKPLAQSTSCLFSNLSRTRTQNISYVNQTSQLQTQIKAAIELLQFNPKYDAVTYFTTSEHMPFIRQLLDDDQLTQEEWISKVWKLATKQK
ncbi:Conserved_hypothetical protein [Hexamita inflata]|uniref:VWFA domain-containing protein n=1 Tax=Hexamita inflata TaxID=28002 RepID=A0AA86QYS4_9EUKA|nr:Conserved hypothetical protein [Hexamita inflata]